MSRLGGVSLAGDALQVSAWASRDPEVLAGAQAALERGQGLEVWLDRVVQVGARAVAGASGSLDRERLEAALQGVERRVHEVVARATGQMGASVQAATEAVNASMAAGTRAAMERLTVGVQGLMTGPDAVVPAAAVAAVTQVTDRAIAEVMRALEGDRQALARATAGERERLAVEVARVVARQLGDYRDSMDELRVLLAVRAEAQAAQASGPRKGFAYEQAFHEALHDVAAAAGDGGADFVGGATGKTGSKKGDSLVTLRSLPGAEARIAFEAKHRPSAPLTPSGWADELSAVLRNREASVAVGVCPFEEVPGTTGVLVIDEQRIVIGWEEDAQHLLGPVYLLARMSAQHLMDEEDGEDRSQELLGFLAGTLDPLGVILKQAQATLRASAKIKDTAQTLVEEVRAKIAVGGSRGIDRPAAGLAAA